MSSSLDVDQDQHFGGPDLSSKLFALIKKSSLSGKKNVHTPVYESNYIKMIPNNNSKGNNNYKVIKLHMNFFISNFWPWAFFRISASMMTIGLMQGSHELWKSWKTWKITKISSIYGKIIEFDFKQFDETTSSRKTSCQTHKTCVSDS